MNDFCRIRESVSKETVNSNFVPEPVSTKDEIEAQRWARAKARKEYMISLDDKRNKGNNQIGNGDRAKNEIKVKTEQSQDVVKLLDSCFQRASAFTIRDKQLKEKELKKKLERDYERMMEVSMEVNRLKDIEAREKEDEVRIKKRLQDRKVIEDQIRERRHQRLLQDEARDQENKVMLAKIKSFQEEDEKRIKERKEAAKKAQKEVIERNKDILKEREAKKALEKEEDERILVYQLEKEETMKRREQEEREAQLLKVEMQKKMLESQTKSIDKQIELDELRARRAAEETERKYRQKEALEAEKRQREFIALHESRKKQEEERKQARQRELQDKKEEYANAIKHANEMARREKDELERIKGKNAQLRMMLRQQIEERVLVNRANEKEKCEEGRIMKEKIVSCKKEYLSFSFTYFHHFWALQRLLNLVQWRHLGQKKWQQ